MGNASGEIIEEDIDMFGKSDEAQAWEEYWRTLYPKVTVNKLKAFEAKYKNSSEERDDVKKAYTDAKGCMDKIMDSVILARLEDEERFREIIDKLIEDKEVKAYKIYTHEPEKKRKARHEKAENEEKEAEEHAEFLAKEKKSKKSQQERRQFRSCGCDGRTHGKASRARRGVFSGFGA